MLTKIHKLPNGEFVKKEKKIKEFKKYGIDF